MTIPNGASDRETLPPHSADWLKTDPSLSVMPPTINTASQRHPSALLAVIDQFDVEHAERYRPRDVTGDGKKETFCNIYCSDVTAALCAPIPHRLGGKWQLVSDNAKWLRSGYNGWKPSTAKDAQLAADEGCPAVVVYDPPDTRHGHIALLVPCENSPGVWLTQAGGRCFARAPLISGFGSLSPLLWYTHD